MDTNVSGPVIKTVLCVRLLFIFRKTVFMNFIKYMLSVHTIYILKHTIFVRDKNFHSLDQFPYCILHQYLSFIISNTQSC